MQESQFRSMQKYIKASEKTRHDFRHNILTLAELYNEGKTDEIGKYLNQYVDSLPKNEYVIFCGNTALNALLNYYVHVTSLNEIDFKLHISIPEHLPVSDVDLCSMVGNIMENAVIACQSADKKRSSSPFFPKSGCSCISSSSTALTGAPVSETAGMFRPRQTAAASAWHRLPPLRKTTEASRSFRMRESFFTAI